MSGGAVAVTVLGMALGVGITGCLAREIPAAANGRPAR